jgi:plastocyanin
VFYAALTDLNYTLAVKEAATGKTKSYNDARIGTTVCGKFDTSGFDFTLTPTVPPSTPAATPTPTPTNPAGVIRIVNVGLGGATSFTDVVSGNSTTTIHVGDTVQWKFASAIDYHSTTSGTCTNDGDPYGSGYPNCNADGNWDSGQLTSPATFSKTFSTPGTYRYFCSVHGYMMTGTVQINP